MLGDRVRLLRDRLPVPSEREIRLGYELTSELEILDEILGVWEDMVFDPLGDKGLSERFAPVFEQENEKAISGTVTRFDRVIALVKSPVTRARPSNELVDPLLIQGSLYADRLQASYRKSVIVEGAGRVFKTADALHRLESFAVRFRQIRGLVLQL
jgi:hypothetical protein